MAFMREIVKYLKFLALSVSHKKTDIELMEKIRSRRARHKEKVRKRVLLSNEREANGLSPDPWVVEYRNRNNEQARERRKRNPKVIKPRTPSNTQFKKGHTLSKKLTPEEKEISKEKGRERVRLWRAKNSARLNKALRDRRKTDIQFRLKCNLRKRLSWLVSKTITGKTTQTLDLLGCSLEFFLNHLKERFKDGMSFENYGAWHIDHIKPCNKFDLEKESERRKCFHYTNMQPLWANENREKSDKFFEPF